MLVELEGDVRGVDGDRDWPLFSQGVLQSVLVSLGQHLESGVVGGTVRFCVAAGLVVNRLIWVAIFIIDTVLVLERRIRSKQLSKIVPLLRLSISDNVYLSGL